MTPAEVWGGPMPVSFAAREIGDPLMHVVPVYTLHQAGVDFCLRHDGIRGEDEARCDFWESGGSDCALVPLWFQQRVVEP